MVKVKKRKPRVNMTIEQRLVLIKGREASSLTKKSFAQKLHKIWELAIH